MFKGLILAWVSVAASAISGSEERWGDQWPNTDFRRNSVPLDEIMDGGPRRDGIPSIDDPTFTSARGVTGIAPSEPVIVTTGRTVKAYPVRTLIWHEIVNDTLDGRPIVVTYCPLCNSAFVFERSAAVDDAQRPLEFGVSGLCSARIY